MGPQPRRLFFVPIGSAEALGHYKDTVQRKHPLDSLSGFLSASDTVELALETALSEGHAVDDNPTLLTDNGAGEVLALAGLFEKAGLDHQGPAVRQRAFDGPGHVPLLGARVIVRRQPLQRAAFGQEAVDRGRRHP